MNVDRYITDEAVSLAAEVTGEAVSWREHMHRSLQRALPGILAQHRADVLREVFSGDPFMDTALVRRGIREEAWTADDAGRPDGHPDVTDAEGRVWSWWKGDLYRHGDMAWPRHHIEVVAE